MTSSQLDNLAVAIERRLAALFRERSFGPRTGLFAAPPHSDLLDQVRDLTLRGGKRLRPALLAGGAALFEAEALGSPAVLDAGTALELLHAYFLIHDDIMDEDETRRGGPSVHAALTRDKGDPKLGRDLAILAGDLAAALHEGLLANLDAPVERRLLVTRIFAEMHLDVVHGQTLDLLGNASAEEVASRKTASYTTVGPLTAGAALGGADADQVAELAEIGRPLGVAFQIRDDLLGVFGEPGKTGKPVGTDLRIGKRTLLLERALTLASAEERQAIEDVLGRPDATAEDVAAAAQALTTCGAKSDCENRITELVDGALGSLTSGQYLEQGARLLSDLAGILSHRDA
ncbi:MAG: polyprenyl synthetase family protein [Deltaproteobacteria bacterium]|nr:polyprenyl synthetase family protein [Deltaproteobacteria bacterium]